jgi:hypothetical protein
MMEGLISFSERKRSAITGGQPIALGYRSIRPVCNAILRVPSNMPMQSTPVRVRKIVRILKRRLGSNAKSIYRCGAADGQAFGAYALSVQ